MSKANPSLYHEDEQMFSCMDEANAIINDVKAHVAEISVSTKLAPHIYLNIRTIEDETYCVLVSSRGFKIVSRTYDTIDGDKTVNVSNCSEQEDDSEYFETPYALLDKISPRYVESFGNQLCQQLRQLQQMRTELNEEDEEEGEDE